MEKVVGIIPARGGSKTVPRKNIRLLGGRPLIAYSIEHGLASRYIGRVLVSTEDSEIAQIARDNGAEVVPRPAALAQDDSPTIAVCQQVIGHLEKVEGFHPETVVILQPTSPLRTVADVDGAIEKFLSGGFGAVVSVCEAEHPPKWLYTLRAGKLKPLLKAGKNVTRRQDSPKIYQLNGAVYVTSRDIIIEQNRVIGDDTGAYIMPRERSLDIDTALDFKLAEVLLKENEADKGRR